MGKHNSEREWQGRLLDAWLPPSTAGQAVACLATSYTFDPVFFEEQCLTRFAGIRNGAEDEILVREYLIEREERLSQIKAAALVDRDHCRGRRSLRWDLLGARHGPGGGILHAKVSLLVWARAMRLVVASANLTESGYRRNRELFFVLDAGPGEPFPAAAFIDALAFLDQAVALADGEETPAVRRWREVLADARARLASYGPGGIDSGTAIAFVGLGPGKPNLFERLEEAWGSSGGACREISAVSRFFDSDERNASKLVDALWSLGAKQGEVFLEARLPASFDSDGTARILAPAAFGTPPRDTCSVGLLAVDDRLDGDIRPLHAKGILLSSASRRLACVGSANLTLAGTGLARDPNLEALIVVATKDAAAFRFLDGAFRELGGVEPDRYEFAGVATELESLEDGAYLALPPFWLSASYRRIGGEGVIELRFDTRRKAPDGWRLETEDGRPVLDESAWRTAGAGPSQDIPWRDQAAPSGLVARWLEDGAARTSWLPICVERQGDLPPPEELKDLPIEVLAEILGSARPLAMIVAAYRARIKSSSALSSELDPLKRFDSSAFLLNRTRRVSATFRALAESLSKPCPTEEALAWRLEGPCGARAVARAVSADFAEDPDKCRFFLSELCLDLLEVEPRSETGCLPPDRVRTALDGFIAGVASELRADPASDDSPVANYIRKSLAKISERGRCV